MRENFEFECDRCEEEFPTIEELKAHQNDDGRCDGCCAYICDEDYHTEYESRGEFWGAPCEERICTGYTCSKCGHQEDY